MKTYCFVFVSLIVLITGRIARGIALHWLFLCGIVYFETGMIDMVRYVKVVAENLLILIKICGYSRYVCSYGVLRESKVGLCM